MRGIRVPVMADPVAGPTVTYGEELPSGRELTSIKFLTDEDGWARVTFEHLDSIRVSRGEYEPYPSDWKPGDELHWVYEVAPSSWLLERYEYEKKHYGRAYEGAERQRVSRYRDEHFDSTSFSRRFEDARDEGGEWFTVTFETCRANASTSPAKR